MLRATSCNLSLCFAEIWPVHLDKKRRVTSQQHTQACTSTEHIQVTARYWWPRACSGYRWPRGLRFYASCMAPHQSSHTPNQEAAELTRLWAGARQTAASVLLSCDSSSLLHVYKSANTTLFAAVFCPLDTYKVFLYTDWRGGPAPFSGCHIGSVGVTIILQN